MIKFMHKSEDSSLQVEVILDSESTLVDVLSAFQSFLKAAGYEFQGVVDIACDDFDNNCIAGMEMSPLYTNSEFSNFTGPDGQILSSKKENQYE